MYFQIPHQANNGGNRNKQTQTKSAAVIIWQKANLDPVQAKENPVWKRNTNRSGHGIAEGTSAIFQWNSLQTWEICSNFIGACLKNDQINVMLFIVSLSVTFLLNVCAPKSHHWINLMTVEWRHVGRISVFSACFRLLKMCVEVLLITTGKLHGN